MVYMHTVRVQYMWSILCSIMLSPIFSPYRPPPKQPPTLPKPQFFTGMKRPCSWDRSLWDLWFIFVFALWDSAWSSWTVCHDGHDGHDGLAVQTLGATPPSFFGAMSQHSGTHRTLFIFIKSVFISALFGTFFVALCPDFDWILNCVMSQILAWLNSLEGGTKNKKIKKFSNLWKQTKDCNVGAFYARTKKGKFVEGNRRALLLHNIMCHNKVDRIISDQRI